MNRERRNFLKLSLGTAAGITPLGSFLASGCGQPPRISTGRSDPRVLADLHAHVMINQWNDRSPMGIRYPFVQNMVKGFLNPFKIDFEHCYEAGVDMLCAAHFNVFDEWLSMPTDPNPEAPANTLRMMDHLERELAGPMEPFAKLALSGKELGELVSVSKNDASWRVAVVHALEGGHALGGDLSALGKFADRGVAMIGITHFFNKGIASAPNAYPFFPDGSARWPKQGLSEFGQEVIAEMKRLGITIDITHCTPRAVKDVLDATDEPLIASHASARTLSDNSYSMEDDHIQEIAKRGGIIGIILDPYLLANYGTLSEAEKKGSVRDIVRTIVYVAKLVGVESVGIGSDVAGFITPPKEMHYLSEIGSLRSSLLREFDLAIVNKIMANNVIEFFIERWKPEG